MNTGTLWDVLHPESVQKKHQTLSGLGGELLMRKGEAAGWLIWRKKKQIKRYDNGLQLHKGLMR